MRPVCKQCAHASPLFEKYTNPHYLSYHSTETMIISGSVSCVIVAVADKAQGQMFGQLIPAVTGLAAYLAESGY